MTSAKNWQSRPWTDAEVRLLKNLRERGITAARIAQKLGRTQRSIYEKLDEITDNGPSCLHEKLHRAAMAEGSARLAELVNNLNGKIAKSSVSKDATS